MQDTSTIRTRQKRAVIVVRCVGRSRHAITCDFASSVKDVKEFFFATAALMLHLCSYCAGVIAPDSWEEAASGGPASKVASVLLSTKYGNERKKSSNCFIQKEMCWARVRHFPSSWSAGVCHRRNAPVCPSLFQVFWENLANIMCKCAF